MNNFLLNWDGDIWNIPKSNSKTRHLIFFSFDIKLSHYWKNNNKDLFTNLIIFILGKTGFTNVEIVGKLIQTSSGLVIGINKYWKSNLPIFNEPWLIHHETFSPLIELSALLSKIIAVDVICSNSPTLYPQYIYIWPVSS